MTTHVRAVRYSMAVALVLCFTSLVMAQSSGKEPDKGRPGRREKFGALFKELNLSQEQQQKITEQRSQEEVQARALRQKLESARSRLGQELDQPVPDKAKIYSFIAEMKELYGKRQEQRVERILSLRQILTPEQFKLLDQKTVQFQLKKEGGREKNNRNGAYRGKSGSGNECL